MKKSELTSYLEFPDVSVLNVRTYEDTIGDEMNSWESFKDLINGSKHINWHCEYYEAEIDFQIKYGA